MRDASEGGSRSYYMVLMAFAALCSLAKGFVFAKLLGNEGFGYYAALDLVAGYGVYAGTWGLVEGLNRQLPLLIGAGRGARARMLASSGAGAVFALSMLALIVYIPVVWVAVAHDDQLRLTLLLAGLFVVANNVFLVGIAWIVAQRSSLRFARLILAKNAFALALGCVAVPYAGLFGVLLAEITVTAGLALWLVRANLSTPTIRPAALKLLKEAGHFGIPMMTASLLANLGRNLDRITVGVALGLADFAQYSFGMLLPLGGMVALNILVQYMTPRVCHAVGGGADLLSQKRHLDRIVGATVISGLLMFPVFFLAIDHYAIRAFPEFAEGLHLMKFLYAGALAQVLLLYQAIMVAAGAGWHMTRQSIMVSTTSATLCVIAASAGLGLIAFGVIFVLHRVLAGGLAYAKARELSC